MKLLVQFCLLLFFVFAFWGVADIVKWVLDQSKVPFSPILSAALSVAILCALTTGMLWGANDGPAAPQGFYEKSDL